MEKKEVQFIIVLPDRLYRQVPQCRENFSVDAVNVFVSMMASDGNWR